ncbi:WxL protein peptidoglycan domain-containing protein [Cellulomonas sp. URHE0023]|uniref:WxL protein peptidoglycan domain-containing protein n=1 Tax=Cellulomonas sp. URHE0023 TaxID=1380354 RepID=UPI00068D691A|nr:DUF916 domain-containing protein [Cellulomonas sp. URHE0023]
MFVASRPGTRVVVPLLVALAALVLGPLAGTATAEEGTAAWSVTPTTADGAADTRTRIDIQLDPGGTTHDQVLVANASTAEQTFTVYAADAFNTADGGYDLLAAATPSTDVGTWVTVAAPTVTVPALGTAVVGFDVTAPAGATPGDHAGGIVVSLASVATGNDGVVIDSRVAVRLAVRISGELTPALEVRNVSASSAGSLVPFGASASTVTYDLVNTGNVKIVGTPRVRVTGPFGVGTTEVESANSAEVLPGQSFAVKTEVPGVAPLVVMTATVDVDMVAAPGPETEIPLTSSTARGVFPSVPWTGLLVVLLVLGAVALVVWRRRKRREEAERLWAQMVAESGRRGAPVGTPPQPSTLAVSLIAALVLAGPLVGLGSGLHAEDNHDGSVTLQVPQAPGPKGSTTGSLSGASGAHHRGGTSAGSTQPVDQLEDAGGAGVAESAGGPTSAPTAQASAPDTVWNPARGWSPVQWLLVIMAGVGAAVAGGLALRARSARVRTASAAATVNAGAVAGGVA